jgi:metal-responsive CopG/Arc/MetJ family transcriptional regulator
MKWCMRTNVVLNEELVEEAMKYSTARSRSALIDEALRVFVQSRAAERRRASYERRLLELRQRLVGVAPRESALDVVRRDRERG